MPRKRKSGVGSEQAKKKQREEPAAAVPSSAAARAAHAAVLAEHAQHRCMQTIECSKLARLISNADSRPLDQRAADVMQLMQEDSRRAQPLLELSHKLAVS
jgi:mevalonate pyrophosphate decarboxylase